MPHLISIGVEGPKRYIAVDEAGHVWSGRAATQSEGQIVITWTPVRCEFPASSEPAALWGSSI